MKEWNYDKLDEMTKKGSKFTKIDLDYRIIADNFEEIAVIAHKNGDVIPLEFDDVKLAYTGNPVDDVDLPEVSQELLDKIDELENHRKVMHIKHFARDITHDDWLDFIDNEVLEFIEKYPQFSDVVKKE